ncbi:MAG: hypothetical protein MPL62_12685 [Alphaproteobacteria bacterium]|nr:hypothetical protein [Alphaproteobacteria bacterium]
MSLSAPPRNRVPETRKAARQGGNFGRDRLAQPFGALLLRQGAPGVRSRGGRHRLPRAAPKGMLNVRILRPKALPGKTFRKPP